MAEEKQIVLIYVYLTKNFESININIIIRTRNINIFHKSLLLGICFFAF